MPRVVLVACLAVRVAEISPVVPDLAVHAPKPTCLSPSRRIQPGGYRYKSSRMPKVWLSSPCKPP